VVQRKMRGERMGEEWEMQSKSNFFGRDSLVPARVLDRY